MTTATRRYTRPTLAEAAGVWQYVCCCCGAVTLFNDASEPEYGPENWEDAIPLFVEHEGQVYLASHGICPACAADYRTPDHPRLSSRLAIMRTEGEG